jgi:hypothetical protein
MNSAAARFAACCCGSLGRSSYILTMACDQSSSRDVSAAGTPSSAQMTATEKGWA